MTQQQEKKNNISSLFSNPNYVDGERKAKDKANVCHSLNLYLSRTRHRKKPADNNKKRMQKYCPNYNLVEKC